MKSVAMQGMVVGSMLALSANTWALTIRDDRADSLYTQLAIDLLPQTGSVTGPGWLGSGTLISPTWVLTAGHVASGSATTFSSAAGTRSIINQYQFGSSDVGLVQLSAPIADYTPIPLYSVTAYGEEPGKNALVAGAGMTGTGLTGEQSLDGKPRAAETTVYANASAWGWSADQLLTWFRKPSAGAANLEGGAAHGDSGGGIFLNVGGTWSIAGVQSLSWTAGTPAGAYDSGGVFIRTGTTSMINWIKSYVADASIVGIAPPVIPSRVVISDFEAPKHTAGSQWSGVDGWSGSAAFSKIAPDTASGYVFQIEGQSATLIGGTLQRAFGDAAAVLNAENFEISVSMMRPENGATAVGGWYISDNLGVSRQAGIELSKTDNGNQVLIWSGGAYHLIPLETISWVVGNAYETTLQLNINDQSLTAYIRNLTEGGALLNLGTYTLDGGLLQVGQFQSLGGVELHSPVGATVFDNVVAAVPEPTCLGFIGMAGMALVRRRRINAIA